MTLRAWAKPAGLAAALVLAAAAPQAGPAARRAGSVPRERINPAGLSRPRGYTHVVTTRGGKHVFVSGQVALDAEGNLVGKGDLKTQADKAFENLRVALEAAGASFADVVKLNTTSWATGRSTSRCSARSGPAISARPRSPRALSWASRPWPGRAC